MFQPLPRQFRVVKVAIAIGKLLIESACHGGLIVFFGQPGTPVQGCGRFCTRRIECDLLLELLLRFFIATLP